MVGDSCDNEFEVDKGLTVLPLRMVKRVRKRDLIIEFLQLMTGIGMKKGKKAAPRFELGIKDLQSSALPLGHAAQSVKNLPPLDRISPKNKNVLVLSNGHGEDLIALRVLQALHRLKPELKLEVIALVGEGRIFSSAIQELWLVKSGTSLRLPSGGFSNQSISGFIQDMLAGFLWANFRNWSSVRNAAKDGSFIVAVGDLLPLFFAWSSGGNYAFIGTPKSDYTWKTSQSNSLSDLYHSFKGSEWEPWEWSLMKAFRCKMVAVRDKLTARGLRKKNVRVISPGNPMMDGFPPVVSPINLKKFRRLLLLCGSRMPEAMTNFKRLLNAVEQIESKTSLMIFVAIGSEPSVSLLENALQEKGYRKGSSPLLEMDAETFYEKKDLRLAIGVGKFEEWSRFAEVGIANAGTATEQLVGLGVPCVSLPGKGPQFKHGFATRQSRLLGGSVIPCQNSEHMAKTVKSLLLDSNLRERLSLIGKKRMGCSGGSEALAQMILQFLNSK